MRVQLDKEDVTSDRGLVAGEKAPFSISAQSEPIAPQGNERRLAEFSSQISEEGFVSLELEPELAPKAIGDTQHEDRLPAELGRGALLLRSDIRWY